MAAPNLVNSTDITASNTVRSTIGDTEKILLGNPVNSSNVYKLNSIMVSNVDGSTPFDVTVWFVRQGEPYALMSTLGVAPDSSISALTKDNMVYLEEGDAIRAVSSSSSGDDIHVTISYEVITSDETSSLVTSGLIAYFDAADRNSYPNPRGVDHGISDWYCMVTGTVRYSAIYPGTEIIEDNSGVLTTMVSSTSAPTSGTFSATAGRIYYGTKAVHMIVEKAHQSIVPLSLAGHYFGGYAKRDASSTYYFYAPYADATVTVYDNVTGGIDGTATTTVSVTKGSSNTYVTATLSAPVIFSSDTPVIVSVTQASMDQMVVPPASTNVMRRRNVNEYTVKNAAPSSAGDYQTSDTDLCFAVEIADGVGNAATQGLGYENLSDTYSWGNSLSDYVITAPYADTTVNVYYYSSGWVLGESHSLNGTLVNPDHATRSGNHGFGIDGSSQIGGASAYLAGGATLWKFESNNPILITINDTGDDEMSLYGWMAERTKRIASSTNLTAYDLTGNGNNGTLSNVSYEPGSDVASSSEVFRFYGTSSSDIQISTVNLSASDHTIITASRYYSGTSGRVVSSINNNWLLGHHGGIDDYYAEGWVQNGTDVTNPTEFRIYAGTGDISGDQWGFWINGVEEVTNTNGSQGPNGIRIGNYSSGLEPSYSEVGFLAVYNRVLTDAEIVRVYECFKTRFDIS